MCAYVYVFYDFILVLVFSWWFKFTLCKHVRLSYVFLINLLTYFSVGPTKWRKELNQRTQVHMRSGVCVCVYASIQLCTPGFLYIYQCHSSDD